MIARRINSMTLFVILLLLAALAAAVGFSNTVVQAAGNATLLDDDDDGDWDDDDDGAGGNLIETYGIVNSYPVGLIGTWNINGTLYTANSLTRFELDHGPFATGVCVELKYTIGTTTLHQLETTESYHCGGGSGSGGSYQRVYGTVDSFPAGLVGTWVVNGISYTTNSSTYFEQEYGTFVVGSCVEIDYLPATNVAIKIEMEDGYHCGGSSGGGGHYGNDAKRYGRIDTYPTGLIGTWVIAGVTYTTGSSTQFEQEDGPFAIGRCVEVRYLTDSGVAIEIETEDDYHCGGSGSGGGGSYQEVYGTVSSFPAGLIGTWVVNGNTYSANNTTIFRQQFGTFAVGGCVQIKFQTTNNLAIEIETEDAYHCGTSTTPPADQPASFDVNHTTGAFGSHFVFVGDQLPADTYVQIYVDGQPVAPLALTDSSGWVTFGVHGDTIRAAGVNSAQVEIEVAGQRLAPQTIVLNNAQPRWNLPANYTAPTLALGSLQALNNSIYLPMTTR